MVRSWSILASSSRTCWGSKDAVSSLLVRQIQALDTQRAPGVGYHGGSLTLNSCQVSALSWKVTTKAREGKGRTTRTFCAAHTCTHTHTMRNLPAGAAPTGEMGAQQRSGLPPRHGGGGVNQAQQNFISVTTETSTQVGPSLQTRSRPAPRPPCCTQTLHGGQ